MLRRIGDKLADKAIDRGIDVAASLGIGGVAIAWARSEWTCIKQPSCQVAGWEHGLLILLLVVAAISALLFGRAWFRVRRELHTTQEKSATATSPRFHDIEIEDKRLYLRWFIRRPPREWIHWRNIDRTVSPDAVQQVLDGPFHALPGCNAPLGEKPVTGLINEGIGTSPQFDDKCSHCGQRVFQAATGAGVNVWPVRAYALKELQRMQRNGTKLPEAQWSPPIVLENPSYWQLMLPPGSTQDEQARMLVPLDVFLEINDDKPTIEFKRKLRIVLRNDSNKEVILREPTWKSDTGDIPTRPHPLKWDRESGQGWTSKQWGGPGQAEATVKNGQVICTWIGLTSGADFDDVRRRLVTQKLGTLVVPLTVDGQTQVDTIRF
jgi:hypothetical protein